jgi:PAS domain-containing protein
MPGTISSDDLSMANVGTSDKKQHKRAANRKSAQLSRKRKKQYIEELKDENDELRRKEQILRSIPDLVVVFDSSGKLGFVSESFSKFLDMPPEKLEGTSFWDRVCHDSVRLLKAAFMDALAARQPQADTVSLGSGVWELRLLDKNSMYIVVTLNGVVHFTGEAPECVCCVRPSGKVSEQNVRNERNVQSMKPPGRLVSSSDGSRSSDDNDDQTLLVNPNQSVMGSDKQESMARDDVNPPRNKGLNVGDHEISESSGSEDGVACS